MLTVPRLVRLRAPVPSGPPPAPGGRCFTSNQPRHLPALRPSCPRRPSKRAPTKPAVLPGRAGLGGPGVSTRLAGAPRLDQRGLPVVEPRGRSHRESPVVEPRGRSHRESRPVGGGGGLDSARWRSPARPAGVAGGRAVGTESPRVETWRGGGGLDSARWRHPVVEPRGRSHRESRPGGVGWSRLGSLALAGSTSGGPVVEPRGRSHRESRPAGCPVVLGSIRGRSTTRG